MTTRSRSTTRARRVAIGIIVALGAAIALRQWGDRAVPRAEPRVELGAGLGAAGVDRTAWLRAALRQAAPGATIDVPGGLYRGPWVIDRPVRLRTAGVAHLRGDGRTHTVAVRADDVTLDGFEISESGLDLAQDHAAVHVTGARAAILRNRIHHALHGVYVRQGDAARIEGNDIAGMRTIETLVDPLAAAGTPAEGERCETGLDQNRRGNGIHVWNASHHVVARNTIRDTRDGVYFSFVDDSDVRGNDIAGVRYAVHYMYSDANRFDDNVFRDNAAGAALMSSNHVVLRRNRFVANRGHRSYGVLLQTVDDSTLEDNEIAGNSVGLFIESGHGNRVAGNRIARNHIGIHISDSSDRNEFGGNRFAGNLHTVETSGANSASEWTIDGRGNQWDGAAAIDLDRDGIADLPHRELDLFGGLRRNLPAIGLLGGSPADRLLRFVHARLALPGLPGVIDRAPLTGDPHP